MKNTAKATPPFIKTDVPRASQDTAIAAYQISRTTNSVCAFPIAEVAVAEARASPQLCGSSNSPETDVLRDLVHG